MSSKTSTKLKNKETVLDNNNDKDDNLANDHENINSKQQNNNEKDNHDAIKQRLLTMEAETKKITQMQNKYDRIGNNNNTNENVIDEENDEIIDVFSPSPPPQPTSSSNNNIEGNDDNANNYNQSKSESLSPETSKTHENNDENNTNANTNENYGEFQQYPSMEDQKNLDERSIFINNLHLETTANELQQMFATCGTIERVTIVCDKWTGKPKGCCYIQFKSKESVDSAMVLNGKEIKGMTISVEQKRTNLPTWLRRGRGRGGPRGTRGRGRGRGYYMPPYYIPPMPHAYGYYRGRGHRGRPYWYPY